MRGGESLWALPSWWWEPVKHHAIEGRGHREVGASVGKNPGSVVAGSVLQASVLSLKGAWHVKLWV